MTRCALCLMAVLLCAASLSAQEAEHGEALDPQVIAERFLEAQHELRFIRMRVDVTQVAEIPQSDGSMRTSKQAITVFTDMAEGNLRTEVYEADGSLSAIVSFCDGRVTEYHPSFSFGEDDLLNEVLIQYRAPEPYGTENVYLTTGGPCLYGSYLGTWLGKDSRQIDIFYRKILAAESIEEIEVDGVPAYRVTRKRGFVDPDTGFHDRFDQFLILEKERMLVMEFTGVQYQPEATVRRERHFEVLEVGEIPEGIRWNVNPTEDSLLTASLRSVVAGDRSKSGKE